VETLFANGHAVDIVLAVMALEFVALVLRAGRDGRAATALTVFFALAPGACILMALRAALTGADWPMVALWLSVSFPIHIADLLRRRL
jgi:hypothetical protein